MNLFCVIHLKRRKSQKLLTSYVPHDFSLFSEIPGKRLLYHQVSPLFRRGDGCSNATFVWLDSTGPPRIPKRVSGGLSSTLKKKRTVQYVHFIARQYVDIVHHFN